MELMEQRNAQIVSQKSSLLYPQSVFIQDSLEIRFCIFPHLFKESWVTINSERGLANILSLLSSDLDIVNTKMGLLFDAISCKYCLILDVEGSSTLRHLKLLSQCMWILGLSQSKWNSSVCPVDLKPFFWLFLRNYNVLQFGNF